MTYTRPFRRTTLQFSQIRLTLARTFIAVLLAQFSHYLKADSIRICQAFSQGPNSKEFDYFTSLVASGCQLARRLPHSGRPITFEPDCSSG
jgi:hypothetical protein